MTVIKSIKPAKKTTHLCKTNVTPDGTVVEINEQNGGNLVTVTFPRGCVIGERLVSLEFIGVKGKEIKLSAEETYPEYLNKKGEELFKISDEKLTKSTAGNDDEGKGTMLTDILRLVQPTDCPFLRPVTVEFPLPTKENYFELDEGNLLGRTVQLLDESIQLSSTVFSDVGFLTKQDAVSTFKSFLSQQMTSKPRFEKSENQLRSENLNFL